MSHVQVLIIYQNDKKDSKQQRLSDFFCLLFPRTRSLDLAYLYFHLSFYIYITTYITSFRPLQPSPLSRKREECGVAGDGVAFFKRNGAAWSFAAGDFWGGQGERGGGLLAQKNAAGVL